MNPSSPCPLIDFDEGVRLSGGNPLLYYRMLSRFTQDPTMNRLQDAVLRGDAKDSFLQAHTLKGLCAQLALPRLHAASSSLCALLRAQTPEGIMRAGHLLPDVLTIYRKTVEAIAYHEL